MKKTKSLQKNEKTLELLWRKQNIEIVFMFNEIQFSARKQKMKKIRKKLFDFKIDRVCECERSKTEKSVQNSLCLIHFQQHTFFWRLERVEKLLSLWE